MRWHKIVAQILLLLLIINVSLAVPVAVREICEACANALDKGEDVSAVSRVHEEGNPLGLTQASQIGPSDSDRWLPSTSEHEGGSFAVYPPSDSDHESMEVHGASSPKQTFTLADWQSMFTNLPLWKERLPPSPVSSTASEDSGQGESAPAMHAPTPESDRESDTAWRPIEGHLSNILGSSTTSDDGSMTSDDASMEVHEATSPKLPLTQSDRWSMSTNLPSSPGSSPSESDHESDMDPRPTEGPLSNDLGSWTASDDGSTTSDDASTEVHEATNTRLPLTQSDGWSMSTNPPSRTASSAGSDQESTDYHAGTSEIPSVSSNNFHSASNEFHPSSDNYLTSGASHPSPIPDDHRADGHWTTSSGESESTSFLNKLVSKLSKLKFWRRISGTTSDA
jgi:hypothetical protein